VTSSTPTRGAAVSRGLRMQCGERRATSMCRGTCARRSCCAHSFDAAPAWHGFSAAGRRKFIKDQRSRSPVSRLNARPASQKSSTVRPASSDGGPRARADAFSFLASSCPSRRTPCRTTAYRSRKRLARRRLSMSRAMSNSATIPSRRQSIRCSRRRFQKQLDADLLNLFNLAR
jgi:hypothetical protein